MRDEFIINRHGKSFVLFAGLLDEAHQRGIRAIRTTLIQVPTRDNNNVAIVHASVTMDVVSEPDNPLLNSFGRPYSDGDHPRLVERVFEGIGDASPENVGQNIAPHLIRMAETRAKARALRDAINVGMTALEEVGDEEAPQTPGQAPGQAPGQRQRPERQPAEGGTPRRQAEPEESPSEDQPANSERAEQEGEVEWATDGQVAALEKLAARIRHDLGPEEAVSAMEDNYFQKPLNMLSATEAAEAITDLQERANKQARRRTQQEA